MQRRIKLRDGPLDGGRPSNRRGRRTAPTRDWQADQQAAVGLAIVLVILVPNATSVPAWLSAAIVVVLLWTMIAHEHRYYGQGREQLATKQVAGL